MTQTTVQDNNESENISESSQMSNESGPASISLTSESESTPITILATIDLAVLATWSICSKKQEENSLTRRISSCVW